MPHKKKTDGNIMNGMDARIYLLVIDVNGRFLQ
jgi:hypothetical protein